MILRLLAAALLCVLMTHAVEARPRHPLSPQERVGCSGPFMWPCGGGFGNDLVPRKSIGSLCGRGISDTIWSRRKSPTHIPLEPFLPASFA